MKSIVCPKCFSRHDVDDLAYGCPNSSCPREAVPTAVPSGGLGCKECGTHMTLRFCPDCGFQLTVSEDAAANLPISIVGSEGCGKSHYLSVLINEIRQNMGKTYHCSLYPLGGDDTILQYENNYYNPLYVDGQCIPSTDQDAVTPLIYSLVFSKEQSGQVCNLTFYDACGANFRSERVMADYNRSVYNSRGILLLIDPSQLPGLREKFESSGRRVCTEDFSSLVARTIQLIRQGSNQQNLKKKISIPIAICLTKIDSLRSQLDPASFLRFPSRHLQQDSFDIVDFSCVSQEVQSLIESWGGTDLINQVKSQFETVGFFGVSSLGNPPNSEDRIDHIAPYRVCDPFLWLLSKNKIIRATTH